jgi:hypothetical protein
MKVNSCSVLSIVAPAAVIVGAVVVIPAMVVIWIIAPMVVVYGHNVATDDDAP